MAISKLNYVPTFGKNCIDLAFSTAEGKQNMQVSKAAKLEEGE